jgi:acyl dehydratase
MKFDSHYVGAALKTYYTNVTWRDTMNYAAAVKDNNPLYLDDDSPNGIVAHPMQCVAVTWPILERIWEFIDLDDFPREILATQVHYTEHLILYRLIRPGDKITVKGKLAAILPHRAGTHLITRLEAFDQDNKRVFTELIGGLMRGVECMDPGRGKDSIPAVPQANAVQTVHWESVVQIDPLLSFVYDGCTQIHFPIHTSKQFAHQVGLPDIILQGTATLAIAVKEIVNREAEANPHHVQSIACRFTGMVIPGSTITIQLISRNDKGDVFFQVLNGLGQRAISHGYIKLGLAKAAHE